MGSGAPYKRGESDEQHWETTEVVGGVKVLRANASVNGSNLPTYSNTSNTYFKKDPYGKIIQMRLYDESQPKRKDPVKDFDIFSGKGHGNQSDGKFFGPDVVHVHPWTIDLEGKPHRSDDARYMNNEEIRKYGDQIREAYPNAKFRPGRRKK